MEKIASELLVERLVAWGVDTVFGLPGDGINGIMEGLRRHRDKIRFVLVHHEEAAAFMATGYAKSTGRLGVCLATSGSRRDPRAQRTLRRQAGPRARAGHHRHAGHQTAWHRLPAGSAPRAPLRRRRRLQPDGPRAGAIPALVDFAVRHAVSRRTVSHLTFPVDLQESPADLDPFEGGLGTGRTPELAPVLLDPPGVPREADLRRAAAVLDAGERVVMLVGQGALHAGDEVIAVAELLGSPIVNLCSGKQSSPMTIDSPSAGSGCSARGRPRRRSTLRRPEPASEADAVLEIHSRPDGRWTWCYREPDRGVELHSNLDYATREAAAISARRAYPELPFAP